jgi:Xaa-Pro dipeptidase
MTHGAFPVAEFQGRVERVQKAMADRGLDALLVTRPQNVYYLTGFRSMGTGLAAGMGNIHAALVPLSGTPVVFVRALETRTAAKYCWTEVEPYRDYEDAYAAIARRLPSGTRRLGIEYVEITALQLERVRRAAPAVETPDVSGLVEPLRRVKSKREIEYSREAGRIAEVGLHAAIDAVKDGARVAAVVAEATRAMYEHGQDDINWPAVIVWSGPEGGLMHDTALEGVISAGHLVTLEVTGTRELYVADAMGTICVGTPSKEIEEGYEISVKLHDAAQRALRAGVSGHEVHAQADRVYQAAGQGPYYRRVGGAIGINAQPSLFFEGLNLLKGESTLLESGMTVLVQPGVDRPAMMIVASTNLVVERGFEALTHPLPGLVRR